MSPPAGDILAVRRHMYVRTQVPKSPNRSPIVLYTALRSQTAIAITPCEYGNAA